MTVEQTNESYNRCIAELRTRYRGRAVSSNAKNELANYAARLDGEENTSAPENYMLFDSRSKIADSYRSGVYNGSKYMTSDDFVRYFKTRRAFYMPNIVRAEEAKAEEAENSAVPARRHSNAGGLTPSESGSKEGHIKGLLSNVKEIASKWFPIERKEDRPATAKFKLPMSALAGIAVFAISTTLIVSGSVMVGDATGEMGRVDSEISQTKSEISELENTLDMKYSIDQLEADAKQLGMVKKQYAQSEYVDMKEEDRVLVYDDNDEFEMRLASLLSAFGIKLKG